MRTNPTSLRGTGLIAEKRDFSTQIFKSRFKWSWRRRGQISLGCSWTSKLSAGGSRVSFALTTLHLFLASIFLDLSASSFCSVEMTGLTDACMKDLCAAVRASRTFKYLELRNNSLTDTSVPALIQVMQERPDMVELWWVLTSSWGESNFLKSMCYRNVQQTKHLLLLCLAAAAYGTMIFLKMFLKCLRSAEEYITEEDPINQAAQRPPPSVWNVKCCQVILLTFKICFSLTCQLNLIWSITLKWTIVTCGFMTF